jgi:hypothetical protein
MAMAVPALAQTSSGYPAACEASKVSKIESDRAHTVFLSGKGFLDESNYDKAISYFKDAYSIDCSVHGILPIIATAYERKGDKASAVDALEEYLRRVPTAPDRDVVERRIRNLKDQIGQAATTTTATATATTAPTGTAAPTGTTDGADGDRHDPGAAASVDLRAHGRAVDRSGRRRRRPRGGRGDVRGRRLGRDERREDVWQRAFLVPADPSRTERGQHGQHGARPRGRGSRRGDRGYPGRGGWDRVALHRASGQRPGRRHAGGRARLRGRRARRLLLATHLP